MRRRNQIIIILLLIVVGTVVYVNNMTKDEEEAKNVADQYYDCLMKNDLETASNYYHEDFLKITPLEDTNSFLLSIKSKLGDITEVRLVNLSIKSVIGTSGTNVRVELVYQVSRTKYDSLETLTLLKENNSPFLIYGYNVNSEGLLQS